MNDEEFVAFVARITDRVVMHSHDGRSGATLERGRLDGHRPVVVKTVAPNQDVTFRLGGDTTGRERRLWSGGELDVLPAGVGHAILAAGWSGPQVVTVMHDLGDAVLDWDRRLDADGLRRVFGGLGSLHRHFAGRTPAGLCELERRVSLFAPDRVGPIADEHPIARAVVRGWDCFVDIVPAPVGDAVIAALAQPASLAARMASGGTTLCHGDAWLVNMALTTDDLVLLDWNVATEGPASLDLIEFVVGCASHVAMPSDDVLALARETCRDLVPDPVWHATIFWALCELGWNKALDAATHADAAQRARARSELDWWIEMADHALASM
jgi:hypothetical protein